MILVQTRNNISAAGLEMFDSSRYEVSPEHADPHAIVLRSADLHNDEFGNNLLAVARAGAGVNNIPIERLTKKGVVVFNTPGANANAVKELVVAGMLLSARRLYQACVYTKQLDTQGEALHKAVESGKKKFSGIELAGRTLGVIGLGAIGVKVANVAVDLGMKVSCYDPGLTLSRALILNPSIRREKQMERLLAQSDFVSFHIPLMDSTRGIFNHSMLQHIKSGCVLLNFSRQEIVDEQAVLSGIASKKIDCFVTDFPSERILHEPQVLCLPHLGASTGEAEENCARMAVEQLQQFIETGNVTNSVNFPHCELNLVEKGQRLLVANDNVPGMLENMTAELSKANLNIIDMLNQSRGELAYTIIDVANNPDQATIAAINGLSGVRKVRVCSAPSATASTAT